MADRGVDLHRVDAERAVAVEDEHLRVRLRDLCADPERQADAHAPERAGVQAVARQEGRDRLAAVVENLLAVDDQDRVAPHEVADLLAEAERMDRHLVGRIAFPARPASRRRGPGASRPTRSSGSDRCCPSLRRSAARGRRARRRRSARPPRGCGRVRRVDVDPDDFHVLAEPRGAAELDYPVEAGPDRDDHVGLANAVLRAFRNESA